MEKPEILAPAGDMEKLRFAVAYGADAVYLAGKAYGMRTASDNFTVDALAEAVAYCHERCVRAYVTVNTLPRDGEMEKLPQYLTALNDMGADALIVADLGVLRAARRFAPRCQIHVSTQTSIVNSAATAAWHELGASRVVLARELSLDEIAYIRAQTPPSLEIEAFVHGAMCMAYSGRCMLSNYLASRDANRGNCA
ncbi:MAG: U32 family peptidase, partial [Clostridia bacterium]|nr:U32 family peptidase [Clostridia bacterium]